MKVSKYNMTLNLNILNHLGLNLYSNVPAVLSEVVANSWDADSEVVRINIEEDKITIIDNGLGMNLKDINDKFLMVGYQKRKHGEEITKKYGRNVMGRKGIGKLSLFSIANNIEVQSVKGREKNSFIMSVPKIMSQISNNNGVYNPDEGDITKVKFTKGTKIILTDLKKKVAGTEPFLRRRLARRFSIIGDTHNFKVEINDVAITTEDRDFYNKLRYLWEFGTKNYQYDTLCKNIKNKALLPGIIDKKSNYLITGWIGAVEKHGDLTEDKKAGVTNNKIILLARGKLVQEDILSGFNEGGLYAKYLIGEINADFLDLNELSDISTSNRQSLIEDDERYSKLVGFVYEKLLKPIKKQFDDWNQDLAKNEALKNPSISKWYDRLTPGGKKRAEKLFATIERLPMDDESDRKELYKYGILAFERLRMKDSLDELDKIENASDLRFSKIFADLDSIEAVLYYDIASGRLEIIKDFEKLVDKNQKEKMIQKHIFDHLWLLHPSWERATNGGRMEESVKKEFNSLGLSNEEKRGRIDIRYKTAAGKHIIVELKKADREVSVVELVVQLKKYKSALQKCLKSFQKENEAIEVICLLGKHPKEYHTEPEFVKQQLNTIGARYLLYDALIQDSLDSYHEYLERQRKVGELREIIDSM